METTDFGWALRQLKNGEMVSRAGWRGGGMSIEVQLVDENSRMTQPYLIMHIPKCTEGLRTLPWQPAQFDLFAEDWEIA